MKRRRFLTYITSAPLVASLPLGCRRQRRAANKRAADGAALTAAGGVVLDALQLRTLEAACARILPTDADPGASEAGAAGYIDAQLAHPPVSGFRRLITAGLKRLQFIAQRMHRSSFAELPDDKQDATLRMIQRSKRMGGRYNGRQFFQILVVLTLEGFLGDPVYGGNKDRVGWKLVGFVPQTPGPRAPYRGRHLG